MSRWRDAYRLLIVLGVLVASLLPVTPAMAQAVPDRPALASAVEGGRNMTVRTTGQPRKAPGGQVAEASSISDDSAPHGVVRRWLSLALLAGLLGGLAFALVVTPASAGPARRVVLTLAAGAGVLATVVGLTDLQAEARRIGTDGPDLLLGTSWGRWWLVRELAVAALALLAGALRADHPVRWRRTSWGCAAVLAVTVCAAEASTGHVPAVASGRPVVIALVAGHALAAFVWLGGLAALLVAGRSLRSAPEARAVLGERIRNRFVPLVAASAAVVAATGVAAAGRELDTGHSLPDSGYGRILVLKVALFLIVAGLGLRHAVRAPQRRLIAAEITVSVLLVLATGALTGTPPPRPAEPVTTASIVRSGSVADLVVTLTLAPARPGANGVTVVAASGRRPPPAPIDEITLDLGDRTGPVTLPATGSGRYAGTAELTGAPATVMRAMVTLRRGSDRLTVPLTWTMPAAAGAPPSPRHDLRTAGDALALAVLALVVTGQGLALRRTRRRAGPALPHPIEPKILEDVQ